MADFAVASQFLAELQRRAQGRRHLNCTPAELVTWYSAAFATEAECQDARSRIRRLLDTLAEAEMISLPKGGDGWLPFPPPKLPTWIRFPGPPRQPKDARHKNYPWGAELAFLASLPSVPHLDLLIAINTWLRDGGRDVALKIPLRERSIEITRHEKALDAVIRCQALRTEDGKGVTLDLLKAFLAPPPLAYECGPERAVGKSVLVLENAHTWHSFAAWNRTAGRYAAVIYGHGKAFCASVPHLRSVIYTTGAASEVRYFGDLDPAGLLIPIEAGEVAWEEGLPIPVAEEWLYEALLKCTPQDGQGEAGVSDTAATSLLGWLPPNLRGPAHTVLRQGSRIAQECIGTSFLSGTCSNISRYS